MSSLTQITHFILRVSCTEPIVSKPDTLEDIMAQLSNMGMLYKELLLKNNQPIEVIESLKTEITKLNSKVIALETTSAVLASVKPPSIVGPVGENSKGSVDRDIKNKVFERQKCMNNLMFFNINISNDRADLMRTAYEQLESHWKTV